MIYGRDTPSQNEEKAFLPTPPPTSVAVVKPQVDENTTRTEGSVSRGFAKDVLNIPILSSRANIDYG